MLKRPVVFVSLFFLCISLPAQKFIQSNQQWGHFYSQFDLSEKTRLGFDAGLRTKNEFSELSQYLIRISYWRKCKPGLFLGGGCVHSGYFNDDNIGSLEYRPFEELLFNQKVKKSSAQIRYRLEERFFTDYPAQGLIDHRFVLRSRLSFSYSLFLMEPFGKSGNSGLFFVMSEEFFVNMNSTETTGWFDQNRILVGPLLKFNEAAALQLQYNLQISPVFESTSYRMTHVFWLSWKQNFNTAKKESTE